MHVRTSACMCISLSEFMPPVSPEKKQRYDQYGHAGMGGAVAFGDVDKKIGFSFICNEMHLSKDLYKTANMLIDSLYSKL